MRIETRPGDTFQNTARKAVDLAESGIPVVEFEFNEIELAVRAGDTAEEVYDKYTQKLEQRRHASPPKILARLSDGSFAEVLLIPSATQPDAEQVYRDYLAFHAPLEFPGATTFFVPKEKRG